LLPFAKRQTSFCPQQPICDNSQMASSPATSPHPLPRILLSVPHMGGNEQKYVNEAFATNWLSTVGPNITAFEQAFERHIGMPSVALASGTAATHLALRLLNIQPDDEIFCPTLTFVATANPIAYLGAKPVFLDSDRETWNLDPEL